MKRKNIFLILTTLLIAVIMLSACSGVWGKDETSENPQYIKVNGEQLYFTLELRDTGSSSETESWDGFPHATTDGELIYSWEIPMYGSTVYESVVKFFEDRDDSIIFRLAEHRYYMFSNCKLINGKEYNLETVYIAADGKYAKCANFIKLAGDDNIAGTVDDLKTLVLVYKGWLTY